MRLNCAALTEGCKKLCMPGERPTNFATWTMRRKGETLEQRPLQPLETQAVAAVTSRRPHEIVTRCSHTSASIPFATPVVSEKTIGRLTNLGRRRPRVTQPGRHCDEQIGADTKTTPREHLTPSTRSLVSSDEPSII